MRFIHPGSSPTERAARPGSPRTFDRASYQKVRRGKCTDHTPKSLRCYRPKQGKPVLVPIRTTPHRRQDHHVRRDPAACRGYLFRVFGGCGPGRALDARPSEPGGRGPHSGDRAAPGNAARSALPGFPGHQEPAAEKQNRPVEDYFGIERTFVALPLPVPKAPNLLAVARVFNGGPRNGRTPAEITFPLAALPCRPSRRSRRSPRKARSFLRRSPATIWRTSGSRRLL